LGAITIQSVSVTIRNNEFYAVLLNKTGIALFLFNTCLKEAEALTLSSDQETALQNHSAMCLI
jgi:hypothetical protein